MRSQEADIYIPPSRHRPLECLSTLELATKLREVFSITVESALDGRHGLVSNARSSVGYRRAILRDFENFANIPHSIEALVHSVLGVRRDQLLLPSLKSSQRES